MKLFSRGKQKSGKPIGKNASGKSSTKPNAKPVAKASSKPATKVASGSAPKKPAQKSTPATKQPTSKPTATTASNKPKSTPTSKPAVKATTKAVPKPAQKSITTPANKPVSKASPRASAPSSAKPQTKTTAIAVSTAPTKTKKEKREEEWAKNVSDKIPVGRSFQTRDEYIAGGEPKHDYEQKGLYRRVFAVATNSRDEMAVAKSTTSDKGKIIHEYDDKSKVRPFIHTEDNEGKPIKKGAKFKENNPIHDMPEAEARKILKESIKHAEDYKKLQEMKKRKK